MHDKQFIKAIILAGSRDFGRCPIASRLPTALWPVVGKPALEHLLQHLMYQGVKQAVICSGGNASLLQRSIANINGMRLKFLDEPLPVGTAGSIRDAIEGETNTLLVVFAANIVCPPEVDVLVSAHRDGQSDLTVMLGPGREEGQLMGEPADIYVCNPNVLEHIPKVGYFDIKEGLIPKLLRTGKSVSAAVLPSHAGNFREREGYLRAIADYLGSRSEIGADVRILKRERSKTIWTGRDSEIDPTARIYGPVVVMDNACVSEGTVIFGPTILGRNVSVGKNSVVANSALWDDVQVGSNCEIQRCLLSYGTILRRNSIVKEKSIPYEPEAILQGRTGGILGSIRNNSDKLFSSLQSQFSRLNEKLPFSLQSHKKGFVFCFAAAFVLIAFLYSYWSGIKDLWRIWQRSDEYSSGLLVPFLTVYVLWARRHNITGCRMRPCIWGLFAFLAAQGVRFFGLFFMYSSAERLSIVLSIGALVLFLLGWEFFKKVSTVLLFLCLMLPWPNSVQSAVALPLQRYATSSAVFCLEMIGYEIIQEGNIIHIGDVTVAVAEACNGLRMITAFFMISGLVVLLIKRAWWEKLIVLASSLPIALVCNTVRLTITAMAFTVLSGEHWEKIFHDFGGYAMMPLSLAMVVSELWLLTKLTTVPIEEETIVVTRDMGD